MNLTITASGSGEWWNTLVKTSSQGDIFNSQWYLDALLNNYTIYKVTDNAGKILAGFCILEEASEVMALAPYPFTPYQGILFSKDVSEMPNHKKNGTEFQITQSIIEWARGGYQNFSMSLSPNFGDVRPFNWYAYGDLSAKRFTVKTRYTAYLELADFSLDQYLLTVRSVRRQEYKKNISLSYEDDQIDNFLENYKNTFIRQGIALSEFDLDLVESITRAALHNNAGILKKIVINNEAASSTLFLYDGNMGYYLFGANNPLYRSTGASTALMIRNIEELSKMGCKTLDFVGVNSPNRGDYKLSFNGVLKPYFQVNLEA